MKTKTVQFVKAHPLFAYDPGETATLLESDADLLIEAGYAVEAAEEKGKKQARADKGNQQATV